VQRIDSHHHFWQYSPEQYPWISEPMKLLRRDFLPSHLLTETQSTHVNGVISVQARQSVEETSWLLALANSQDWILGVVGWLPLSSPSVRETMAIFRHEAKLCGLRHVVQDEHDDGFLARTEFNEGIQAMKEFGWTYDLLIYARQLPFAIPFVDRHPDQVFVLDHIAKPTIQSDVYDAAWDHDLRQLAKRPNVYCKFSGVATEVRNEGWSLAQLQRYWDTAIEAFGSERLMFGTDWPVCLLKASYAEWVAAVSELASKLSETEQVKFWSQNAIRAYQLT
jgi:L-fuconolactonase